MRRADRQQDRAFALDLIDRCSHGVVAISSGEDTPYCLPLSLVRVEDALYFHCARAGRKLDLLRRNPRVCVTFVGEDTPVFLEPAMYSTYFQSAIGHRHRTGGDRRGGENCRPAGPVPEADPGPHGRL